MQESKESYLLKKEILEILSKRDLGIKDAFSQIDSKIQQAFAMVEIKTEVLVRCLALLGITQTQITEITNNLQTEISNERNKSTEEATGNDPYNPTSNTADSKQPTTEGITDTEQREQGTEFFS
jgi:hypothetical protein